MMLVYMLLWRWEYTGLPHVHSLNYNYTIRLLLLAESLAGGACLGRAIQSERDAKPAKIHRRIIAHSNSFLRSCSYRCEGYCIH